MRLPKAGVSNRKVPTIADVAALAQVSKKTVSRVINREAFVRKETCTRVVNAMESLDYHPSVLARSLAGGRMRVVGLAYSNPNAYYVVSVQQGALGACYELGYDLQIYPSASNIYTSSKKVLDAAHRSRLAGLVLAPPMSENKTLLDKLRERGVPFVRIISSACEPSNDAPCVFVDDRYATYAIIEHLLQLGHSRIGFLWGREEFGSSVERRKGYEMALRAYGVSIHKSLSVRGDYTFDDGFRGASRLLRLASPPTAIFGSNDEIAAGAMAAARAIGLEVPRDLSVVGFEDSPFARFVWPALTTVRQDMSRIAEHATRMLIARVEGTEVASERFVPQVVVRGSTTPLSQRGYRTTASDAHPTHGLA